MPRGRKRLPLRGIAVAALLALLIGGAWLARAPLANLLWRAGGPLMQWRYTAGEGALRAELASSSAALTDRDALYAENLDLKARLGRSDAPARVLGAVLSRPPASPYDTLLIDAGSSQGVAAGDFVAAAGSALIGTVSEVYADTARVELFSSPGDTYDALLATSGGNIPLSIEGQGGGSLSAKVPAATPVRAGDSASLPGILGGITARVTGVERGDSDSYATIYFSLPADVYALRYVEVWKK